ncbi:MAG: hypothetical protein IJ958_04030 [Agathobacter sp.]|nr:hypothetical protein [Agathobacter sp.]
MGYCKFSEGSYLVSEMIQWWFWRHPQKDERYQIWFPGEHFAISYAKKG